MSDTGTMGAPADQMAPTDLEDGDVLIRVRNLTKHFPITKGLLARTVGHVRAVDDVSFDVRKGETLGLVGESGSGKSTTGRVMLQLDKATSGTVEFDGRELTKIGSGELRRTRPRMQMVFQDPHASLNPRMTVGSIVGEPLVEHTKMSKSERRTRIGELLDIVGLDAKHANRYPHEFSGGQCQRISIARAVITEPAVIICDEPVSALDVSVQAQILNLLEDMKERYGLTLVFVAHDLAVVKNVSDRVAVMYLGKMCEIGPPDALYAEPAHPYTEALLSAIPLPDPAVEVDARQHLGGELPSPIDPPSGCRFRTRCPRAQELCAQVEPQVQQVSGEHWVACHFPLVPVADGAEPAPAAVPAPGSDPA